MKVKKNCHVNVQCINNMIISLQVVSQIFLTANSNVIKVRKNNEKQEKYRPLKCRSD